ncbi:hypothetical protein SDC9_205738 [bioreactor metagenome]|uniref:Uncharacterized protein n=1 Tax=bioreactor metagenome TaxID=1076179 RepID=A0A645J347_9ZZZZ
MGSSGTTGGKVMGGTCVVFSLSRCLVERKTSCVGLTGGAGGAGAASTLGCSTGALSVTTVSGIIAGCTGTTAVCGFVSCFLTSYGLFVPRICLLF